MELTGLVQNLLNGLLIGGVYALVGVGLSLIFGVLRIINFAHGDFVVIGMYSAIAIFGALGIDPYVGALISLPLGFLLGLAIEKLLLARLVDAPPESTLLATLGLALIIQNSMQLIFGAQPRSVFVDYGTATVRFGGVTLSVIQLLASFVIVLVIVALWLFLTRTETGRAVRATSQNRLGAELVGIDTLRIHGVVFATGLTLAMVAGILLIPQLSVTPVLTGPVFTLKAFVVTVLGGLGSVWGAIGGGLLLGVVEVLGASYISNGYRDAYGLIAFLAVLLLRPEGLFGRTVKRV
jgi:branched-chain amino acid transport system permease protein